MVPTSARCAGEEGFSNNSPACVESYRVDYRAGRAILPADRCRARPRLRGPAPRPLPTASTRTPSAPPSVAPSRAKVMYPEFKRLTQRAGCVGYTVWIAGRHADRRPAWGDARGAFFQDELKCLAPDWVLLARRNGSQPRFDLRSQMTQRHWRRACRHAAHRSGRARSTSSPPAIPHQAQRAPRAARR